MRRYEASCEKLFLRHLDELNKGRAEERKSGEPAYRGGYYRPSPNSSGAYEETEEEEGEEPEAGATKSRKRAAKSRKHGELIGRSRGVRRKPLAGDSMGKARRISIAKMSRWKGWTARRRRRPSGLWRVGLWRWSRSGLG